MLKDFLQLSRLYLRMYWLPSAVWAAIQVIVISYYRHLTIVHTVAEPIPETPSNKIIITLAGIISLSFMTLLIFLGNLFSSGQRGSWLRQMPFRASTLNIFPLLIIFLYGLILLVFLPWGAFTSGVAAFCIGIPIAIFIVLKNSSHYIIGLFKSAATGVALILMWAYLFYDWSTMQSQFIVEFVTLLVFTAVWLALGSKERKYTLSITAAFLILLAVNTLFHQTRIPQNFSEATLDHAYFPTEKTWTEFKKMALDNTVWESADQFSLPSYVRYKSQDFVESLSDAEKIQFIENIESNRRKWKDARLPEYRPLRFASYFQPDIRFRNYSAFPIGKFNVSPTVEKYLYKTWSNSRLYCQLLPYRRTSEFLEKIFSTEECAYEFFNQGVWSQYSLVEYGEFERQFDQYLLDAFDKAPSKIRSNLMRFLISGWGLNELKGQYDSYREVIFSQEPLSPELLEQIKTDRHRVSLSQLKKVPQDREGFLKEVENFSLNDKDAKLPVLFLCQYLHDDCNLFLNRKKSESLTLLKAWALRAHALNMDDAGIWTVWLKENLASPKNWPNLEKLLKYVEQRQDG